MANGWRAAPLDLVVLRCLEQEPEAWHELYTRTGPSQVLCIERRLISSGVQDRNEVEQIRNDVFASLMDGNGGHLRAFKEAQGLCLLEQPALDQFLARLARNRLRDQVSAEQRRHRAESGAAVRQAEELLWGKAADLATPESYQRELADLFERSSPAEREALAHHLGLETPGEAPEISAAALRQRDCRLRQRVSDSFGS